MKDGPESSKTNGRWANQKDHNMILWVGKKVAGQVFRVTEDAKVAGIAILPEIVPQDCDLQLTMHRFDSERQLWSAPLQESTALATHEMEEHWLQFRLTPMQLEKGKWYGFQLHCDDCEMAIAEGIRIQQEANTLEWVADPKQANGYYHKDFHLSYSMLQVA